MPLEGKRVDYIMVDMKKTQNYEEDILCLGDFLKTLYWVVFLN